MIISKLQNRFLETGPHTFFLHFAKFFTFFYIFSVIFLKSYNVNTSIY